MQLSTLQALLLDMDGVLYRGPEPLPGAQQLSETLAALDLRCVCLTNNSSKTPTEIVEKLAAMNIAMRPEQILTSSTATGHMLRSHHARGTTVCYIGMHGLEHALFHDGYFVPATTEAELVVVGVDFKLDYDKLKRATLAIRRGAAFYATNADRTFPAPEGLVPGAGSIIAALEAATDRQPTVIGKPQRAMFDTALDLLKLQANAVAMVGDRLDTDIAGAQAAGIATIWLASGVHSRADVAAWQPQPDLLLDDLGALLAVLREERL